MRSLEVAGIIRNVKGAKGGAFVQTAEPDPIVQAMQDIIVRLACARYRTRADAGAGQAGAAVCA
ncbi:hypothetical protein BF95_24465 [Sphingobium sp. Ant17]|nr:hypothetical protein BF95_24465 [Sphingobium sp. Ant17]